MLAVEGIGLLPPPPTLLIEVHLALIRKEEANRAVNKTVTLPNWMSVAAMDAEINFSNTLQEAIREKLGI